MKNTITNWRHKGEADKEPLHYTACGLDDVYLMSGYEVEKTSEGDGVSIKKLEQLHNAIGCSLVKEKKVLSGKELRFLRKQMDLSQAELGALVGLTSQQVARWEKGESEISGAADVVLRLLFIEHAGGNINMRELVEKLNEMDSSINEKFFFEKTANGWKSKAA
jgi:DNA-binding transcriptional regulator YiaG